MLEEPAVIAARRKITHALRRGWGATEGEGAGGVTWMLENSFRR